MNLILLAAAKFEVDPLVGTLQEKGLSPKAITIGVGSLNSAKNAHALAEKCRGAEVIFVGTCGTFGTFESISLVRARSVLWSPTCERTRLGYTIKDTAPPIELINISNKFNDLPEKTVLCSPTISLIKTLPEGLKPKACVENIELYSIASEVMQSAASFATVLAITNRIGEDAHAEWKQNFAAAAGMTAEYITKKFT